MSEPIVTEQRGFRAPGTRFMVAGGLIGALGAYVFQLYGGRMLGPEAFAPSVFFGRSSSSWRPSFWSLSNNM
jgi:hypothetical protein